MPRIKEYNYEYLARTAYERWLADTPSVMAVDTETTGLGFYDEAFCVTVAWDGFSGYFERGVFDEGLAKILKDTPRLVFHNAKFDLQKLILAGVINRDDLSPDRVEDTECIAYLIDERREKKLKTLARDVLGLSTNEDLALRAAKMKLKKELGLSHIKDISYDMLPRATLLPYALKDAEFTFRLWQALRPYIQARDLQDLFAREMELMLVVLDLEANGMAVDLPYVDETTKRYNGKVLAAEMRITDLTGLKVWYPTKSGQKTPENCFNPNSWQQLLEELAKRGTKLEATDKKTLEGANDELATVILELRHYKKLLSTYLLAIKAEQRGCLIHPWFNLNKVVSGRFSSSGADDG